ncbi:hypothetical protein CFP56_003381 [Quercus suber]|uniref:Zinc knuckle CX2CX4HX4C domain-containing protein n=1 Tax=Quercus suber TaxID=58331 RepID=A0AAW0LE50_QUESU
MEEITERYAGLKLSLREDAEVVIHEPVPEEGLVLIGKFCTKRRVNLESVARVLKSVWKTENNFEVSDLGENKVMFLFQTKDDMDRVLFLCPWSFDKYLLILHKLKYGEAVKDVKFDRTPFWVQVHGLPTMCQTKAVGMSIGATLGEVEKVDANETGFYLGSFLRIRVIVDVSMLLCQGRKIRLGEYGLKWVEFKYERLPIFCYLCGKIDHDKWDCLQGFRIKEMLKPDEKQFGSWLRVNPDKHQKSLLITTMDKGVRRIGDTETESWDRSLDAEGTTGSANPSDDKSSDARRTVDARADVVNVNSLPDHDQINIPKISPDLNFEKQLQEIVAEIMGNLFALNTEPSKEVALWREDITLRQNVAKLDRTVGVHTSGLIIEAQNKQSTIGPPGPVMALDNQPGTELGLTTPGINFKFKMGPTSPKQPQPLKIKKNTGGEQRKTNENRGEKEKKMVSGRECMHSQEEDRISDHSILVLKEARSPRWQRRQPKLFRFESMWLEDG